MPPSARRCVSIPGFAAACGGSSGAGAAARTSSRTRSASRTGRSTSTRTRRRGDWRDARRVRDEVRRQGRVHRRTSTQLPVLREGPGPALARAVDRPRPDRVHRQRALPGDATSRRAGWRSSTRPRSQHLQPRRRPAATRLRPEPRVQPAMGLRDDRDRLQRVADEADHVGRAAPRGQEPEGQRRAPRQLRRHPRARHLWRTATTRATSPTTPSRKRSTGSRLRQDSGQIRSVLPATTTRARWPRATSRHASRGRATSTSSGWTTRT